MAPTSDWQGQESMKVSLCRTLIQIGGTAIRLNISTLSSALHEVRFSNGWSDAQLGATAVHDHQGLSAVQERGLVHYSYGKVEVADFEARRRQRAIVCPGQASDRRLPRRYQIKNLSVELGCKQAPRDKSRSVNDPKNYWGSAVSRTGLLNQLTVLFRQKERVAQKQILDEHWN